MELNKSGDDVKLTREFAEQLIEFQKEMGLEPCILEGNCLYRDSIDKFLGIGYMLEPSEEEL